MLVKEFENIEIYDNQNSLVDKSLYFLFEVQAKRLAHKIAVIDTDGKHSYQHLYDKSQALAKHLYRNGARKNELIAILCEKGLHQVVSLLGILRTGAAYLPLDEEWPLGRLEEILKEGLVKQLVVTRKQLDKIKHTTIAKQYIITVVEEIQFTYEVADSHAIPQSKLEDIAYVIFTSGSTGKPKGVVISYEGALTTIKAVNERFKINERDAVLAISKLSFDLSVYDIFGMLIAGGTIVFPHESRAKDPSHWYELIIKHQITVWNTVPQLMQLLIDYTSEENKNLGGLKYVLLSGDWIPLTLSERIRKHTNDPTIMSLGGATEGSIWSIWYEIKNIDTTWKSIPYGTAMPNQMIHVLDENGEVCPPGMRGEIYIGGKSVALGYWNDKEKTENSFVTHPIWGKMFKTGDLGCWNKNGYVEFLGRRDHQIKLHGHRIELEEISSKMCFYPNISEAVVLIKMFRNSARLVAYYISTHNLNKKDIKKHLSHYLPHYMVPSHYFRVKTFPLTENGKLDKAALLSININEETNYVAPRNELEVKICRLWAEILHVGEIGIKDDFFQKGGDSMLATQLAYKMSKEVKRVIRPTLIFAYPNVMDLLSAIENSDLDNNISKVSEKELLLSFQQEVLLKEELINPRTSSFPIVFEILKKADVSVLRKSLVDIVKKHEILRTLYQQKEDGNWRQVVKDEILLITEENITEEGLNKFFKGIYHETFDLTMAYPIKGIIYHTEKSSYLVIIIHTIAFDGWSIGVFMENFEVAYLNYCAGKILKPIEIQYKNYALWQREYFSGKRLERLIQYWHNKLHDYQPFHFQQQKLRSAQISSIGNYLEFSLDEITSKNLRELAGIYGMTLYTILLSALYILIYQHTKQEDLAVVSLVANRPSQQMENLIGYFVNNVIFRVHVEKQKSLLHFMHSVHNTLIESEAYRETPFELIMSDLGLKEANKQRSFLPIMLNVHDFRSRLHDSSLQEYLKVIPVQKYFDIAKFDLGFFINDGHKQIKGILNYATCLYNMDFVVQLKENYVSILNNFIAYKDLIIEQWQVTFPHTNRSREPKHLISKFR